MNAAHNECWTDAMTGACLFAIMPHTLLGVRLRAGAGPVRERWLELFTSMLEPGQPVRRVHPGVRDAELLGGLDLAATLVRGEVVCSQGVLANCNNGILVLAMAERCSSALAARIAAALDAGSVQVERDAISGGSTPAAFGMILLDEGEDGEAPPAALLERVSLNLDLSTISMRDLRACSFTGTELAAARQRLARVHLPSAIIEAIASTALSLGVMPLRASMLACAMARASAALFGRDEVDACDAALAARLVLAPQATMLPEQAQQRSEREDPAPSVEPPDHADRQDASEPDTSQQAAPAGTDTEPAQSDASAPREPTPPTPTELVLEAAAAAIPKDLLQHLLAGGDARRAQSKGRSGSASVNASHGRALEARQQNAAPHARLDLISTLRAAAPWQRLRKQERARHAPHQGAHGVHIRAEDFRSRRYVTRSRTTTVFAVDASGSAALHRLAETKGAVELMLAQCYVRRDQVAVISFRDQGATLALPPTRSLVRAKRSLAGLIGGGGTPLAAGLDAVTLLADAIRRRGDTAVVVILSDGRANVAADCSRNRERAHQDALRSASQLRQLDLRSLFIDTSMRPDGNAACIAKQMGSRYLALPFVDAQGLSRAVMQVTR